MKKLILCFVLISFVLSDTIPTNQDKNVVYFDIILPPMLTPDNNKKTDGFEQQKKTILEMLVPPKLDKPMEFRPMEVIKPPKSTKPPKDLEYYIQYNKMDNMVPKPAERLLPPSKMEFYLEPMNWNEVTQPRLDFEQHSSATMAPPMSPPKPTLDNEQYFYLVPVTDNYFNPTPPQTQMHPPMMPPQQRPPMHPMFWYNNEPIMPFQPMYPPPPPPPMYDVSYPFPYNYMMPPPPPMYPPMEMYPPMHPPIPMGPPMPFYPQMPMSPQMPIPPPIQMSPQMTRMPRHINDYNYWY